jgi:hypothetical protein
VNIGIIRKSSITGLLLKARTHERELVEKEMIERHSLEVQKIAGLHELKLLDLKSEIDMLNRVIDTQKKQMIEAQDSEARAKQMMLKVQEFINRFNYEYKKETECKARSMAQYSQMGIDLEMFNKKMIGDK